MMQNYKDKTYNAAIYLRLSKEDGDSSSFDEKKESDSIASQRLLIQNYLKCHPEIISAREFIDDGYTGTNFDRPQFQHMMDLIRTGEINCVVVKDTSRFGRDYIDSGRYIEKIFPELGVRFISINNEYDSAEPQQAGSEIILPFINLMNDQYSRDISVKVRSNLMAKWRNGEYVGPHVPYGYLRSEEDKHHLIIDKAVAPVIQHIYSMKIDGMSPSAIANELTADGIPSPSEYKRLRGDKYKTSFKRQNNPPWSAVAVLRILKNEIYTGVLIQGKTTTANYKIKKQKRKDSSEWIRVENTHEAIITPACFDLVQRLLSEDPKCSPGEESVYLFSGKIFCADCQARMIRKKTQSGGREYVYFICSGNRAAPHLCKPHRIREQKVYDAVLTLIQAQIAIALDLEKALQKLDGVSWERRELEAISQKIKRQEELIDFNKKMKFSSYEDVKAGIITPDEYAYFKEEFDNSIQTAEETIHRLYGNRNQIETGITQQQGWLAQFREFANIQQLTRRVVVHFIDRIEISEDKEIHITLNYSDEFQSITAFLHDYKSNNSEAKNISGEEDTNDTNGNAQQTVCRAD